MAKAEVTTRLIEGEEYHGRYTWSCEKCGDERHYDGFNPDEMDINYCPACGLKITEYVALVEDEE